MKLYRSVDHEKGPLRSDTFAVVDGDLITHDVVEPYELPTEEEIDKLWYKYADTENDFGNLFLGRDSYDLLIDELTNLLKGE